MAPPTPHRGPPTGPPPPPPPPVAPYGAPGHSPAPYGPAPYGGTHPYNRPSNPPRPWRRWAGLAAALAATAALTAAITHALTNSSGQPVTPATPAVETTSTDKTAAKERLCGVFDIATRDQNTMGGFLVNNEPNMPVVLRALNRSVALENALSEPAVPADLAAVTRTYITRSLDLTTAATGGEPVDRINELTIASNDAWRDLAGLCGLPR